MVGSNNETKVLQFRYNISMRAKTNAFKPRPMAAEDRLNCRYSQLGGCISNYQDLLNSDKVGIVWEVKITNAIPAVVTPTKPKFWLKCATKIKPHTAVKLQ